MIKSDFIKSILRVNKDLTSVLPSELLQTCIEKDKDLFKKAVSAIKAGEELNQHPDLNTYADDTNSSGWNGKRFTSLEDLLSYYLAKKSDSKHVQKNKELQSVFKQIKKKIPFSKTDISFVELKKKDGSISYTKKTKTRGGKKIRFPNYKCSGRLYTFCNFLQNESKHSQMLTNDCRPDVTCNFEFYKAVNMIMESKSYSEMMSKNKNFKIHEAGFKYYYALIKNIQDPCKYPLYFKEWRACFSFFNKITFFDYDSFSELYQDLSIPEEYKEINKSLLFSALIDCLKLYYIRATHKLVVEAVEAQGDEEVAGWINAIVSDRYVAPFDLKKESRELWLKKNYLEEQKPKNLILFGPPGTGKTFHTTNRALEIIDKDFYDKNKDDRKMLKDEMKKHKDNDQIVFTTFHQSMSYEDFIEGIKPVLPPKKNKKENTVLPNEDNEKKNNLQYTIEDGIFKLIVEKCNKNKQQQHVLIIDEINRGNIASIFGELITLIEVDKRTGMREEIEVKLPYSKNPFSVPSNLNIIATMNTADRSVEALDTALRRRFLFEEMIPDPKIIGNSDNKGKAVFEDKDKKGVTRKIDLVEILKTINERIEILIDRDHTIGHSYFLDINTEDELRLTFKNKIIPLLQEYFYSDYGKIGLVLGDGFIDRQKKSSNFSTYQKKYEQDYSSLDINNVSYSLKNIQEEDFPILDACLSLLKANTN